MTFQEELEHIINKHSMENGSDTPDFLLARYLYDCLAAFNSVTQAREKWYGRPEPALTQPSDIPAPDSLRPAQGEGDG